MILFIFACPLLGGFFVCNSTGLLSALDVLFLSEDVGKCAFATKDVASTA
jgi:hypothetical protein